MDLRQDGFSLVGVMVAAGVVGVLALAVASVMKNLATAQLQAQVFQDQTELATEIRTILSDDRHCRVSLAGNGPFKSPLNPVIFKKSNADEPQKGEGLNVELWLSNQAGDARTTRKFSATDPAASRFGKLRITSMKLALVNGPTSCGGNYCESSLHSDVG